MKEVLSQNNVRYAYVDICESVGKLKQFLKLRDTDPAFEQARQTHGVGIPALVVEDQMILIEDVDHAVRVMEALQLAQE